MIAYNKIFQIGFNKCGTNSFHFMFKNLGLNSIHDAKVGLELLKAQRAGHPLLSLIDQSPDGPYDVYTDIEEMVDIDVIRLLDQQYPNSKFILNTRNIDNWIKSRINHGKIYQQAWAMNVDAEKEARWRTEWQEHHQSVRQYFQDRPHDLLVYHIENDSIEKVKDFFQLSQDISFPHKHQSHKRLVRLGLAEQTNR